MKGEGWHLNIHPLWLRGEGANWGLAQPPPSSKRHQPNGSQRPRSAASPASTSVTDVATAQGSWACACVRPGLGREDAGRGPGVAGTRSGGRWTGSRREGQGA